MHAPLASWLPIKTDFLMRRCICLSPVPPRYLQGTIFLQLQRAADENMPHKKQSSSICPRLLSLISIIVLSSSDISKPNLRAALPGADTGGSGSGSPGTSRFFCFAVRAVSRLCGDETRGGSGKRWGSLDGSLCFQWGLGLCQSTLPRDFS